MLRVLRVLRVCRAAGERDREDLLARQFYHADAAQHRWQGKSEGGRMDDLRAQARLRKKELRRS